MKINGILGRRGIYQTINNRYCFDGFRYFHTFVVGRGVKNFNTNTIDILKLIKRNK